MEFGFLVTAFVTLFVVIEPIGLSQLFVALTQGLSTARKRKIALHACVTATGILVVFAAAGDAVLGFIGISLPAFRIAGGILLFLTALEMLFEKRTKRREDRVEESNHEEENDPSIFPLAIPLIAGPGSITSVILLTSQAPGIDGFFWICGVMLLVILLSYLMFLASGLMERALGRTGVNVVTRLLGMLLAALAVQFVLDGLSGIGVLG